MHFDPAAFAAAPMRWATLTAILLVLGALGLEAVVLRPLRADPGRDVLARETARQAARWAAAAALLLLPLALWRLLAQVRALTDPGDPVQPVIRALLFRAAWGRGWWFQIIGAVLAVVAFLKPPSAIRVRWALRATAAGVLALSPAFSGHAIGSRSARVMAVSADWVHTVAAGGWLGTMVLLVVVGLPAVGRMVPENRGSAAATMLRAFSPLALACAALLTLTGVFAGFLRLSAVSQLWTTGYGVLLTGKLCLVAAMAGLGALNWKRMVPRLAGRSDLGPASRTIGIEVTVGLLLLLVTAALIATPFPAEPGR